MSTVAPANCTRGHSARVVHEQDGIVHWACRCGREWFYANDGIDGPYEAGNVDVIADGSDQ